jgi:hypothetical protein
MRIAWVGLVGRCSSSAPHGSIKGVLLMNTTSRLGPAAALLVTVLALLPAGCGKAELGRLPVYGSVSCSSGEKLSGSISFLPDKGNSGPAATTGLVNGEYHFDRNNGPTAGTHRVVINKITHDRQATRALPPRGPRTDSGASAVEEKTSWTLSADVPAGGPYRFDFKVEP